MKRVAIMIYPDFCLFEIAIVLEQFAMSKVEIDVFAIEKKCYVSEEKIQVYPDKTIDEIVARDYDAVLFTGIMGEELPIKNKKVIQLIQDFNNQGKVIGAISAGPALLLAAGILKEHPFMCGCPVEGLKEEGFTDEDLSAMIDWDQACSEYDTLKFVRSNNIITAVAYGFREWAMMVGQMLEIDLMPKSFGLDYNWRKLGREYDF